MAFVCQDLFRAYQSIRVGDQGVIVLHADLRLLRPYEKMIFGALNRSLQVYFVKRFGPNVNLANMSFDDIVSLETLRWGLRPNTLFLDREKDEPS